MPPVSACLISDVQRYDNVHAYAICWSMIFERLPSERRQKILTFIQTIRYELCVIRPVLQFVWSLEPYRDRVSVRRTATLKTIFSNVTLINWMRVLNGSRSRGKQVVITVKSQPR